MSPDIYENSAALFSQARVIGVLARVDDDILRREQAQSLLDQARDWFVLLDDVTGLRNAQELQIAIGSNGPDPWLGSF